MVSGLRLLLYSSSGIRVVASAFGPNHQYSTSAPPLREFRWNRSRTSVVLHPVNHTRGNAIDIEKQFPRKGAEYRNAVDVHRRITLPRISAPVDVGALDTVETTGKRSATGRDPSGAADI